MKPCSRLVIYYRKSRVMEIPGSYASLGLGGAPDNDIRIVGEDVRPHHLVIRRRGRRWYAISRGEGLLRTQEGREARQLKLGGERVIFGDYGLELEEGPGRESTATALTPAAPGPRKRETEIRLTVEGPSPRRLAFGDGRVTLGRDPSNHVVLRDGYASAFHASLEQRGGGWFITDLGSKNGLFVDGRKVVGCAVEQGSLVRLGKTIIRCEFGGDPDGESDFLETAGLAPVVQKTRTYARAALPVLVTGESGTGKEVLARYLHRLSGRGSGPFVPVNCGAVPEPLAESLLFGHRRGSFTGADENFEGFMGAACGGTLMLDEIGELPSAVQSKLLRMLDGGSYSPVGDTAQRRGDARIVSATNRDLLGMVRQGSFRQDLYHRLAVLTLHIPPLRERPADVEPLALHILESLERSGGHAAAGGLSPSALEKLRSYWWPGNVRELRNILCRAAVNACGDCIGPEHIEFLPGTMLRDPSALHSKSELVRLMESEGWRVAAAARKAGVPRSTLRYRLRRYGILKRE